MRIDDLNDDLSDLLDNGFEVTPRKPIQPEIAKLAERHTERCPKCAGSGQFRSYMGRAVGQCFACKGRGSRTFKTSAEDRAQARQRAAERRETQRAAGEAHPDVIALREAARAFGERARLAAARGRHDDFAERHVDVATDLANKVARYGSFASEAQEAYARKVIGWSQPKPQADAPAAAPKAAATALPNILSAVQHFARVRVGEIAFAKKNAEPLWWIKSGEALVGKLTAEGAALFPRRIADAGLSREALIRSIEEIEADPVGAIKAHGIATGSCGCCGRELTDPESIAIGIGPICLAKLG